MLDFDEINIIDFQEYLGVNYQINKERIDQIQKLNGFQYYFLGRLLTHKRNRKTKKQNRKKK